MTKQEEEKAGKEGEKGKDEDRGRRVRGEAGKGGGILE